MGHVDHQLRPALASNFGEPRVRDLPRIGTGAGHDQLRPVLPRQGREPIEVDPLRVGPHAVTDEMVQLARNVQLHAVGQMSAVGQIEAQHCIARLQRRHVDCRVGLRAGMRLDVGMFGPEDLLGASASQFLGDVDELATAVVAMTGIALGVFIGKHAAHGLHDGGAGEVFRGDQFQAAPLAVDLAGDGGPKLGVLSFDRGHKEHPVEGNPLTATRKEGKVAIVDGRQRFVNRPGSGSELWNAGPRRYFCGWISRPCASTGCSIVSLLPRVAARFGKS